jgi:protein-S-isoprenylcysteine O-methyltransferase Ste14
MNNENIFRFIGLGLVLISFTISATFRRRAAQTGEEISTKEEGSLILTLRTIFGLGMWLSTLIYFINPRWLAWAQYSLSVEFRWMAAGIMTVCIPLFYWLFSSLDTNITRTVVTRQEHQLVTHGPYRWIRHPLYTIGAVFFLSLSVLAANWFLLILMLIGFSTIMARTPIEEAKLIERFGDEYRSYMEQTGRYLPKIF